MLNCKSEQYAVFVVPTGIGASVGGYAGDASLWARKLSKNIPLIVNPNVVNAACFSGINENMLYVEGWTLEALFRGDIGLKKIKNNKIGVIFDFAIPQEILNVHINTINAIKTVYGIDVFDYTITKEPVGVHFFIDESGISTGGIKNQQTLLQAGKILQQKGATAIAIVCLFDEPEEDNYEKGEGVDVVGGVEGIISHYLTSKIKIPCVHAPAFTDIEITTKLINPKACAEYITPTFLPCLFFGLENAPQITPPSITAITVDNIKALILPATSLGNSLVFNAVKRKIPIIAIEENTTVLDVSAKNLDIQKDVTVVKDIDECIKLIDSLF